MFAPTETIQLGINKNENIFYSRILHATSALYSFSRTIQSGLSSVESAQHVLHNKCSLRLLLGLSNLLPFSKFFTQCWFS